MKVPFSSLPKALEHIAQNRWEYPITLEPIVGDESERMMMTALDKNHFRKLWTEQKNLWGYGIKIIISPAVK